METIRIDRTAIAKADALAILDAAYCACRRDKNLSAEIARIVLHAATRVSEPLFDDGTVTTIDRIKSGTVRLNGGTR